MKLYLSLAVAVFATATTSPVAQQPVIPELTFESVPNLLKLPPTVYMGEAAGVAVNSKGHIFVFHRSGNVPSAELFEFGPAGAFIRQIGKGIYGFDNAHAVRVDKDDNIWCVDEGANMVIEFSPEGRVLLVLGRKWEIHQKRTEATGESHGVNPRIPPPPPNNREFRLPTDVTWDPAGNIYVSDGYENSRVAKLAKTGDWVTSWGEYGKGPSQFNTPHTIVADAKGTLYVGDRGNSRIQVFDTNGKYQKEWTNVGAPWAMCITPPPNQVIYTSDSVPGRIYKLDLNGHILGAFGKAGKSLGQFGWVHGMTCRSENELYVAELLNWRVQKLILHPAKTSSH